MACCLPARFAFASECMPQAAGGMPLTDTESWRAGGLKILFVPRQVAKSSQSEGECQENILAALGAAVERLPRKWAGVKVRRASARARTNAQRVGWNGCMWAGCSTAVALQPVAMCSRGSPCSHCPPFLFAPYSFRASSHALRIPAHACCARPTDWSPCMARPLPCSRCS